MSVCMLLNLVALCGLLIVLIGNVQYFLLITLLQNDILAGAVSYKVILTDCNLQPRLIE